MSSFLPSFQACDPQQNCNRLCSAYVCRSNHSEINTPITVISFQRSTSESPSLLFHPRHTTMTSNHGAMYLEISSRPSFPSSTQSTFTDFYACPSLLKPQVLLLTCPSCHRRRCLYLLRRSQKNRDLKKMQKILNFLYFLCAPSNLSYC